MPRPWRISQQPRLSTELCFGSAILIDLPDVAKQRWWSFTILVQVAAAVDSVPWQMPWVDVPTLQEAELDGSAEMLVPSGRPSSPMTGRKYQKALSV